jgi:hypothetical protein
MVVRVNRHEILRAQGWALLVFAAALFALPATSAASYDPISSGVTKLKLDRGFLAALQRNGVKLSAKQGATLRNGVVSFPVMAGKFDPTQGKGTVEHEGVLVLAAKRGSASLKQLQLKTTRRSAPLAAKVGGGQLKLGTAMTLRGSRDGFGEKLSVPALALAGKVVARLNKRLHLQSPLRAGMPLGSATTAVSLAAVTILGSGRTSLELDPGFAAKLDQLHVAVNPIFPAEHPGAFTFTIFGGRISPDLTTGNLETQGGIEMLQLGGGQVIWRDPVLDLDGSSFTPEADVEPSPPYAGKAGPLAVTGLGLASAQKGADPRQRTISLTGAPLTLAATTAATLNEVFARPQERDGVFAAGEVFGSLSFVAQAQ